MPAMLFAAEEMYRPAAIPAATGARISRRLARDRRQKDWPSKPGLPVAEQKAELTELLDRAVQLKLNAIIFQVRPSCDAMYASSIEPWSEYLTGTMGEAPQPFYDPLAFAIEEAHRRGLELHAWFNPFRALHPQAKSPVAPNHISRTHPELVRKYGSQLWLDPGEPAVRAYVLGVIMDVVRRYDVDGVQLDDYFYPYPEKDRGGARIGISRRRELAEIRAAEPIEPRRLAARKHQSVCSERLPEHQGGQTVGEIRYQPVWHLAADESAANPGHGRLRETLRRLAPVVRQRLARLFFAATLLVRGRAPAKLSRAAQLVGPSKMHRAGTSGRDSTPPMSGKSGTGRNCAANCRHAPPARRRRGNFLSPAQPHGQCRLADVVRAAYAQPALVPASPWLDSVPPGKPKLDRGGNSRSGLALALGNSAANRPGCGFCNFAPTRFGRRKFCPPPGRIGRLPNPRRIGFHQRRGPDRQSEPADGHQEISAVRIGKGTVIWQ